jgi:hypothetical protein
MEGPAKRRARDNEYRAFDSATTVRLGWGKMGRVPSLFEVSLFEVLANPAATSAASSMITRMLNGLLETDPEAFLNLGDTNPNFKPSIRLIQGSLGTAPIGRIKGRWKQKEAIVKFLKEYPKINLDQDETDIVYAILGYGTPDLMKSAIENGHITDLTRALDAVFDAQDIDHLNFVRTLIDKGLDVNKKGPRGKTPLHIAGSRMPLVRLLLDNGADVNATDDAGFTPLIYACLGPVIGTIKLLVENGADVNKHAPNGMTPLKAAEHNERFNIAAYLRSKGATA